MGTTISEKLYWNWDGTKVPNWECLCGHPKQGLFLSVSVEEIDEAVDLGEPTSFLDHVYLGCTQGECKPNESVIEECRKMFESRISAGATEKLLGWERPHAKIVACSCDMEGHAKKCVQRYCELTNKKVEQLYKVSHPCLDDHQFKKKEELESFGGIVRSVLTNCLEMIVLGRPDILWSMNKLARSVTKWTQACDKRLAWLISCTHHTNDYRQYGHDVNTAQHCGLGLFQDSDFAGDLEGSKSTSGVSCVFLEAEHWFQSVGCARNKHNFRIVPQSLKLFLWMLDFAWMGYLVTVAQGNLGRYNPTIPAQGNLSMFNPTRQFVIPERRPNVSIENKLLIN